MIKLPANQLVPWITRGRKQS